MTRAADRTPSTRLTAGWFVLLAVTVVTGIVLPPAGAVLAAVGALIAHGQGNHRLRTVFVVLAVVFLVLSLTIGLTLVTLGGGDSATAT